MSQLLSLKRKASYSMTDKYSEMKQRYALGYLRVNKDIVELKSLGEW